MTLLPGGLGQELTIVAFPTNGFTGTISVTLGTLPTGVTVTPSTFSVAAGSLAAITVKALATATPATTKISLTGTSGALTDSATFTLAVAAPNTGAALNTRLYGFGDVLVGYSSAHTAVTVTNTGSFPLSMAPAITGDPADYRIQTAGSCTATLAAGQSCNEIVVYAPKTASAPAEQTATLNFHFGHVPSGTPATVTLTGTSAAFQVGTVTATKNPQVALYTMTLPFPGKMQVNFGTTHTYGTQTWSQSTDTNGQTVSIYVAGMKSNTLYYMAARVTFDNGTSVLDNDHTFKTGFIPSGLQYPHTTTTTSGMTPQPGVELLNPVTGVIVSNLQGDFLWSYSDPGNAANNAIYGVKQLPNGNMLMTIGSLPTIGISSPPESAILEMREVNLEGDTVKSISIQDLNGELAVAPTTCTECRGLTLQTFHHDVLPLANGHWIVLTSTVENLSPSTTPALTNEPAGGVLGDVIIDLDENLQPVWAWNEFNHLDPNRHPFSNMWPDWTHTNAVIWSPDDNNLIVSMRHQNWVVKVNYNNGTGDGSILWHLGKDGDFALKGGTDPVDWNYAQHWPNLFTPNSSGVFSIGMMDNGDDRFTDATTQDCMGGGPNCYSTIPVFQIDDSAKTATLTFHQILPHTLYSNFGGNTEQLANGNVEYDLCGETVGGNGTPLGSLVNEVTQEATPKTVWSMNVTGTNFYRAFRIPSLYPGIQW